MNLALFGKTPRNHELTGSYRNATWQSRRGYRRQSRGRARDRSDAGCGRRDRLRDRTQCQRPTDYRESAGTIEETAEIVTARGGRGIAVRCDHTVESDVEELFGRVQREQQRMDLLVNNAWGGYEHHDYQKFSAPFQEQPLRHWDGMFTAGVRAALLASRFAVSLMLPQRHGLIVNITAWDRDKFLVNVFYDVAKGAINRMTYGIAGELRPHNIAAIALAPGFMRTERVTAAFEAAGNKDYLNFTESPEYAGRQWSHWPLTRTLWTSPGKFWQWVI